MKDIVTIGNDLGLFDSQVPKATNILSVQLGSVEYAPDLGIDLKYFLSDSFRFQNASFRAYLIEILAHNGINVASVLEQVDNLATRYSFELTAPEDQDSLIAR